MTSAGAASRASDSVDPSIGPGTGAAPDDGTRRRLSPAVLTPLLITLLTGLALLAGYVNKARCVGPEFDAAGRSGPNYEIRHYRDLCYSDIQHLWLGRDINEHVFPYVHGGITPDGTLYGGSVEYPVLTGLIMWAGAIFAHDDGAYLRCSALLLAPFGLLTGALLGRLSRWRALLWAIGPPLVLYAFHNWDLPAVACAVAAVAVMHDPSERLTRLGLHTVARRGGWAGLLLGAGFAFKLYPGAFVLPLALYVLTAQPSRLDWAGALRTVGAAAGVAVAVNLPFAVAGYSGWWASITFQQRRLVDNTTNSIWYWGLRPWSDPGNRQFQNIISVVSPTLVLASFALALYVGLRRYRHTGVYPWVQVSAAMLVGFLLLHKVDSPQYMLWLLPFFVLVRIRWGWIAAYLVCDAAMGLGIFRWFYELKVGGDNIVDGLAAQAVMVGVWGRAALLVALFGVFLSSDTPAVTRSGFESV
jgi:uncharacterized membrane protein